MAITTYTLTNPSSNYGRNRQVLIGLTEEFDVKGKLSGKDMIFNHNGAVDVLGYFLNRIGYHHSGHEQLASSGNPSRYRNPYRACGHELNIKSSDLRAIWREIDRKDSTNKTIRAKMHRVFGLVDHNPDAVHPDS